MSTTIRAAVLGDEALLAVLNGFVHELHVANRPEYFKPTRAEHVSAWFRSLLQKPAVLIWIAEEDGVPVGYVLALFHEREENPFCSARRWCEIDQIADARRQRVPTPALNRFVEEITAANPPVSPGRKHVRIMYAAQIGVAPPSFVFFTNVATTFHFSYERFLINRIREQFGFVGSPIRIQVRRRKKSQPRSSRRPSS